MRPLGPKCLPGCGALWRKMAAHWMPLRSLCRLVAGRPQIIRSIGWSDLGDHQWSDLRSSAVWLCSQELTGQMVDDERNDWKKFSHARAWGARRTLTFKQTVHSKPWSSPTMHFLAHSKYHSACMRCHGMSPFRQLDKHISRPRLSIGSLI